MKYSGGPATVMTLGWLIMNLGKLIGAGVGRNVGLLLDHGKAVSLPSLLVQRKWRAGRLIRLMKRQSCQPEKHQFHLNHHYLMGKELQRRRDYLTHQLKKGFHLREALNLMQQTINVNSWYLNAKQKYRSEGLILFSVIFFSDKKTHYWCFIRGVMWCDSEMLLHIAQKL